MHRLLALGDSYTIGEGVQETERWPNQLAELLRARKVPLADPIIFARTAWTTDELWDAIAQSQPEGPFDLVSLLTGVNDQYRGRPVDAFASEYALLLGRAAEFARGDASRVVALSIPDWGATPFAASRDRALIAREIEEYNARARELTRRIGARWIDVTRTSRDMLTDSALIVADGLHPSGQLYRRWAELVLPIAATILTEDG